MVVVTNLRGKSMYTGRKGNTLSKDAMQIRRYFENLSVPGLKVKVVFRETKAEPWESQSFLRRLR